MKTYSTGLTNTFPILILTSNYQKDLIDKHYIEPYLFPDDVLIGVLPMEDKKAPKASIIKDWITEEALPLIKEKEVKYVIVNQGDYFKRLANVSKTDAYTGYVVENDGVNYIFAPHPSRVFYEPERISTMIKRSLEALVDHAQGNYSDPGSSIDLDNITLVTGLANIVIALGTLCEEPALAVDIEGFSLKPTKASIGTISFAKNTEKAIAFKVALDSLDPAIDSTMAALRGFFSGYEGELIFHHAGYDISAIIRALYMDDIADTEGLLNGLSHLTKNFHDTKIIAYLATNTCSGNNLGLKELAQEFAGNYAEDNIHDIKLIPEKDLLIYNGVDTLSTWYVFNKYYPKLEEEGQLELYKKYFLPFLVDIIQMQLTGLPLNMERVYEVKRILEGNLDTSLKTILNNPHTINCLEKMYFDWIQERNSKLKKKRVTYEEAKESVRFNPNSGQQLSLLLYDQIGLPILETTDKGFPSTSTGTIKNLRNHTNDPIILELLEALIEFAAVGKLLSAFIPAFLEAEYSEKLDWHYLCGSFNLGGTVSGRLSSSNPNLQQVPSKGDYGKLIKSCFQAPKGRLLVGLDFASLEDRISALTTKDHNKLKVYLDKYDGHSLRAYAYFSEEMPDIDPDSVDSINSIAKKYPKLRQDSKAPTFLLTYGGSYLGLMKNCGFSKEAALEIESRYHELYKESDSWVADKLKESSRSGYVVGAFGLKVRTPLLAQTIRGNKATPPEAEAEGRTAGNALGQSWCLLNNRAQNEFLTLVRTSEYANLIRPCAAIHDATYYEIPEDIEILEYVNKHLVKAVNWNDHPDIYHPDVGLGGELSVFFPGWHHEITIPNDASRSEILAIVDEAMEKYNEHNEQD